MQDYVRILGAANMAIQDHAVNGKLENSFADIAKFWGAYLDRKIEPQDVALMMVLFKVARQKKGVNLANDENLIDICGYAAQAAGV